jgi:hypothetical protein
MEVITAVRRIVGMYSTLVAYDDKRNGSKKLVLPDWEGGEDCASDGLKDNGVHRPWSVGYRHNIYCGLCAVL